MSLGGVCRLWGASDGLLEVGKTLKVVRKEVWEASGGGPGVGLGEVCGVWGVSCGFLGEFREGFEGSWGARDAIPKMYKNLRFSMVFEISECPKRVLRGSWGWT